MTAILKSVTTTNLDDLGFTRSIGPHKDHENVFRAVAPGGRVVYKHEMNLMEQFHLMTFVGATRLSDFEKTPTKGLRKRRVNSLLVEHNKTQKSRTQEEKFSALSFIGSAAKTALMVPLILAAGVVLTVTVPLILLIGLPLMLAIGLPVATVSLLVQTIRNSDAPDSQPVEENLDMKKRLF